MTTVRSLPHFYLGHGGLGRGREEFGVSDNLAAGHLADLAAGNLTWTNVWKGFGALAGAYVFAALASRKLSATWRLARATLAGPAESTW